MSYFYGGGVTWTILLRVRNGLAPALALGPFWTMLQLHTKYSQDEVISIFPIILKWVRHLRYVFYKLHVVCRNEAEWNIQLSIYELLFLIAEVKDQMSTPGNWDVVSHETEVIVFFSFELSMGAISWIPNSFFLPPLIFVNTILIILK